MMNKAQRRTMDDLIKRGVSVYIDKGGRIRHLRAPVMNLPSVRIVLKREVKFLYGRTEFTKCERCGATYNIEGAGCPCVQCP